MRFGTTGTAQLKSFARQPGWIPISSSRNKTSVTPIFITSDGSSARRISPAGGDVKKRFSRQFKVRAAWLLHHMHFIILPAWPDGGLMKGVRPVQLSSVILVLIAFSAMVRPPLAHPMQLPEGATASGGGVSRSENCPGGRQQDEPCLPGGQGSPAGSDSTPTPPVTPPVPPPTMPPVIPPAMPPTTFPIAPPSGIPPVMPAGPPPHPHFPLFIWGTAKAMLHIHDGDQDVTYDSDVVGLIFLSAPKTGYAGNHAVCASSSCSTLCAFG